MADQNTEGNPVNISEGEIKKEEAPRFTSKQKAAAAAVGVAGLGAAGTSLALTGTGAAIGTGITSGVAGLTTAATASAAATTGTLAATGSALGAALMAPIAGLSIGVPVVAPVVVGIALIVYLLVKKNKSNKELYEVMSQAVELIMRIEKCEILMGDILSQSGYISNNVTLNKLLEELMNEILRICPSSVIKEFEEILNSGTHDAKIKTESDKRSKEWTLGLRKLRRFTANNFFTKYRYSFIINKLTMINAFFTTLFAEFTLTKMILDDTIGGVKINRNHESIKGLIDSLKQGHKLNAKRSSGKYDKQPEYSLQQPLLEALTPYIKGESSKYDEIKGMIADSSPTNSEKVGGGRRTKRRNKINKKK
jgi:hypothetical protein